MSKIQFTSGIRSEIREKTDTNREIQFVLSTSKRDRHGTVLNQDNWHLENYKKNPIVAYCHNTSGGLFAEPNPDNIIAKCTQIGTEGRGKDKKLVAVARFEPADLNPLAEKVFRKVLFGSLQATSVGFMEVGQGKYGSGRESQGRDEQTYYFEGQELLEFSIVNIPSNPEAGKRLWSQPIAIQAYALKCLSMFRPSEVEKMTIEDLQRLIALVDQGKDENYIRALFEQLYSKDARLRYVWWQTEKQKFLNTNGIESKN